MKIAIIGAGQMARIIAQKAKSLGLVVYCFAWEEGAVAKDYVDNFYPISIFEKERILNICKKERIDGVIATTELTILIAAYIAEQMGLNGNPFDIASNITNKRWVRERTKQCRKIHHPQFMYIHDAGDYQNSWSKYPAIVKPVSEGGKRGIVVIQSANELNDAIQYTLAYDKKQNGILIEEFLEGGQEYSVEGLSFNGEHQIIQVTEKISSGPPHCVELGHHQPASLSIDMRQKVEDAIKEVLIAVGLKNGPTHTEIKIMNDVIYLIEINARLGGDHIAYPLTVLSTGYDYISEIIQVATNNTPKRKDEKASIRCTGVHFITKQTKMLKAVFDECDNQQWLYEKHVQTEELEELTHNDCYHTNYFIYCDDKRPVFDIKNKEGK